MSKVIVSYGGGTNSTALLVGLHERGERVDAISFSDTGDEKPHTYSAIEEVSRWCVSVGFPAVEIIREEYWLPQQVKDGSLSGECLRLGTLPAKAFGFGTCSLKWKIEPGQRWLRRWCDTNGVSLEDVVRLVGFDAGEPERVERAQRLAETKNVLPRQLYPLYDWGWGRDECVAAIARAGLKAVGKSACFMCPSSKKWELIDLRDNYPDLMARALEIERRAMAGEGRANAARVGLGRQFEWGEFLRNAEAQAEMFAPAACDTVVDVCDSCYDGEAA